MRKIIRWLVARIIKDYNNIDDITVRARYGALEGWLSIVINVILFVIKISIGLAISSVALIADAVHTLSDSITSIVVIIGFKIAKKPSDKEHPFGHGRIEAVITLVIAVMLFVVGIEFFKTSVAHIFRPKATTASFIVIALITGTMLIKEIMAQVAFELGSMIKSKALEADGVHHRSDVLSTALVVVALIGAWLGFSWIDGVMGVFVSFIIAYSGYSIAKTAIDPLLGEAISAETLKEIERIAKSHNGILGVHDIIYHKYGQMSIISLHVEVSDKENVNVLHALSEAVEEDLGKQIGGVVVVHIDPINKDHPKYDEIAKTITEIIEKDNRVNSFHELRIIGNNSDKCNVVFDIALEMNTDEREVGGIIQDIGDKFKLKYPEMKTVIKAEPKFVYNL